MTVIELGQVGPPDAEPEPGPEFRFRRHTVSRAVAAGLAVLCAVGLGGAARPAPPTLAESWSATVPVDSYPYAVQDIVLINSGDPGRPEVRALDAATGATRWAATHGEFPNGLSWSPENGRLYSALHTRTVQLTDGVAYFGTGTMAVDGHTGRTIWQRDGDQVGATAGEVLLGDRDDTGLITRLHLVRATDATELWQRPITPVENAVVDNGRIVFDTTGGEITTLRLSDGVPLATRRIDPPQAGTPGSSWQPQVLNGLFYDIRRTPADTAVTAYRVDTLTETWRATASGAVYVQDCGPVVCVSDTHLTIALDPATGARRWQLAESSIERIDDGHLLVGSRDEQSAWTVVDSRTGATVATAPPGGAVLTVTGKRYLVVLRDVTAPVNHVAVARWDPATGRQALLGSLPGRTDTCSMTGPRLLCYGGGRLGVTDLVAAAGLTTAG
ncbi:hypothetical protein ACWT_7333 [Actinoplanes sp. SE50]|uniref:outer membrane protein assembly factor BamB family protein n=1 Tax=unclassified Actinoplanes TaxID=2626549 RepID=UPI00023EDFCE|nr:MULTISPECIES: PQQ-binding-like beta-propeller repeat protein [unclassified Actinoplanes]AEV88343.1 hypothetical protein ACPL_7463 [Actinoplanes sp. SE50/110]ATO86748.1 hypothetical protein ACWT_7333 [Actinoplanes sp. SE50]SLM04166.1 hypothetical protein ACSP50_7468 [Actinoplanes sp. SE50/110]